MREKCVAIIAAIFFYSNSVWSQGLAHVRGELACEGCDYTAYAVEIQELNSREPSEQIQVHNTGEFDIRVPQGTYRINVSGSRGIVRTEIVNVGAHSNMILLRLPFETMRAKPGTGVISVARMRHKVSKQAIKHFNNAQKHLEAGDLDGSLDLLQRATQIDEEYLEAWNNLGCRYIAKKQPMEALVAFRRAIALDPHAPFVHANLAIALISLGKADEAEAAARQALLVDSTDKKAQYILGVLSANARR